jgi:hypothetical protein
MSTYVAFLRAINVAGHAILKMEALKESFAAAGCGSVRTSDEDRRVRPKRGVMKKPATAARSAR